jgi:hypothetical protein
MKNFARGLAVVGLISAFAGAAGAAELITNGSFETGDLTGWTSANTGYFAVISGSSSGFFGVAPDVAGAEDGRYYLADGTNGQTATYSQTFNDVAGAFYGVSLWYASNGGAPSTQFLAINNVTVAANNPAIQSGWLHYTTSFTGSGSDTLSLGSRNDPNANFFDNISVTGPSAVPEASTWALMILGFGGMGAMLRRRRSLAGLTTA